MPVRWVCSWELTGPQHAAPGCGKTLEGARVSVSAINKFKKKACVLQTRYSCQCWLLLSHPVLVTAPEQGCRTGPGAGPTFLRRAAAGLARFSACYLYPPPCLHLFSFCHTSHLLFALCNLFSSSLFQFSGPEAQQKAKNVTECQQCLGTWAPRYIHGTHCTAQQSSKMHRQKHREILAGITTSQPLSHLLNHKKTY